MSGPPPDWLMEAFGGPEFDAVPAPSYDDDEEMVVDSSSMEEEEEETQHPPVHSAYNGTVTEVARVTFPGIVPQTPPTGAEPGPVVTPVTVSLQTREQGSLAFSAHRLSNAFYAFIRNYPYAVVGTFAVRLPVARIVNMHYLAHLVRAATLDGKSTPQSELLLRISKRMRETNARMELAAIEQRQTVTDPKGYFRQLERDMFPFENILNPANDKKQKVLGGADAIREDLKRFAEDAPAQRRMRDICDEILRVFDGMYQGIVVNNRADASTFVVELTWRLLMRRVSERAAQMTSPFGGPYEMRALIFLCAVLGVAWTKDSNARARFMRVYQPENKPPNRVKLSELDYYY